MDLHLTFFFIFRSGKCATTSPFAVAASASGESLSSNLFRLADPDSVGLNTPKKLPGISFVLFDFVFSFQGVRLISISFKTTELFLFTKYMKPKRNLKFSYLTSNNTAEFSITFILILVLSVQRNVLFEPSGLKTNKRNFYMKNTFFN